MLNKILYASFITAAFILNGCLQFNTVSYEVNMNDDKSGKVTVLVHDIRSDAANESELKEDKDNLFQFMQKSDDFISQMKDEGKNIVYRELIMDGDTLNAKVEYTFKDISKVEGIIYDKPFYFLTLALNDSVISTNGEVIVSEDHKRIMWDNSMKTLKFTMFSTETEDTELTGMSQFYEEDK